MSNIDNVQFVDQAQLKQVMLANADKADKRYAKKSDVAGFVKAEDLGTLASKNVIGSDDLDPALAGVIDGKADAAGLYTAEETDAQIEAAIGELGALASQDTVAEDDLADGLKNKINDVYTKSEVYTKEDVYTKDETDAAITARVSTVYKPAGTINATMIPEPNANILGYVYNLAEDITTTEAFVEGAGKVVKAGTNIVVVEVAEDTYKLDAFAGTIDLSDYVKFEDINVASSAQINSIIDSIYAGSDINDDPEVVDVVLTAPDSLREVVSFFADPAVETVNAKLNDDISIPLSDDGKFVSIEIPEGKTVNIDLNGHDITCPAYAMIIDEGATVELTDATGEATIKSGVVDRAVPAIRNGGTLILDGVNVDTTNVEVEEGHFNWGYGLVNFGSGTIEVRSGHIHTDAASCLSITNGTGTNEGSTFIISGNTVLESDNACAIYMADNKNVILKDNVVVKGGIIARMGNFVIEDNAQVITENTESIDDYGTYLTQSGCIQTVEPIFLAVGCYGSNTTNNDLNVTIKDNATITSANANAINVYMLDTLYDQTVNINIEDSSKISVPEGKEIWHVYDHDACAEIAAASGKTLKPKAHATALTITMDGETVFSNVDSGTIENPDGPSGEDDF